MHHGKTYMYINFPQNRVSRSVQNVYTNLFAKYYINFTSITSLSARILHRAPPPRLQVDQNFLTQKIATDLKMRCHQNSFGIWRVTVAILGKKTCFFKKKHIWEKIHNKSHYFFIF